MCGFRGYLLYNVDTKPQQIVDMHPLIMATFLLQKQLSTVLHKSQQRIDERIKKWQDMRQAVESVKVSKE